MTSFWTKCANFDLEKYSKELTQVSIKSPAEVLVIVHSKDQITIPRELSAVYTFDGSHIVDVTIDKTIDLNQKKKPCYDVSENNGKGFGENEYELLMKIIMERFNCTTPFIPAEFRKGSEICGNEKTMKLVHDLIDLSLSSNAPVIWKSNYFSIPPCVYHTYTVQEKTNVKGKHY